MSVLLAASSLVGSVLAEDVTTPDPDTVTPGIIGFIVTFMVMAVTLLLVIDMVRRVRRVNYRAQVQEELQAEIAERDAAAAAAASGAPVKPAPAPATGDEPSVGPSR
ncbi:hypothetical protein [Herbiconiux sp.]|jgi:hypothetical protein|uniref:hypothetical protein n=1 Tax=Herbiconiux sp. TaxID=1871186 RepID=UPI0025B82C38|nr:hypothetical protein [Herbiconiux sp.]